MKNENDVYCVHCSLQLIYLNINLIWNDASNTRDQLSCVLNAINSDEEDCINLRNWITKVETFENDIKTMKNDNKILKIENENLKNYDKMMKNYIKILETNTKCNKP